MLSLRVRDAHRRISLPASVVGHAIDATTLRGDTLEIVFAS